MPQYLLTQFNNHDTGHNTMVFESANNLAYWVNQSELAGLHYQVIKLCKRHQQCKGIQKFGKCCRIIANH